MINLKSLEKAKLIYDKVSDSIHIIIEEEDADKAVLLENNIAIRIKNGKIIEITIYDLTKILQD